MGGLEFRDRGSVGFRGLGFRFALGVSEFGILNFGLWSQAAEPQDVGGGGGGGGEMSRGTLPLALPRLCAGGLMFPVPNSLG